MNRPSKPRWIDIGGALTRATAASVLDEFGACDVIERGLAQRRLRARAAKIELLNANDEANASRLLAGLEPHSDGFQDVPPPLLADGEFTPDFFENIRFNKPVCFRSPQTTVCLSGLQLHLKDFNRLMRDSLAWDVAGVMKGRPKSEKAWMFFIITVVDLEREGLLTEEEFPNAASLKKKLADEMALNESEENELDERTFGPYATGLWEYLVRGN